MTQPVTTSRALFLDRDGIINEETNYLYLPDDVRWVEGIFPLCRVAVSLGYKLVVVTNQSGIARGLYTVADFDALMLWMSAEFIAQKAPLDGIYFCPYHPTHGIGEFRREHPDRKPGPGMLLRAAEDLHLDLSNSFLIGIAVPISPRQTLLGSGRPFYWRVLKRPHARIPTFSYSHSRTSPSSFSELSRVNLHPMNIQTRRGLVDRRS